MKRRHFLNLLPSLWIAGGCGSKPFYFIQMADTQLGMIDPGDNGNIFTAETAIMETVIDAVNSMTPSPSFVANCGDMTNIAGHPAQIAEYRRLMGLLAPGITLRDVPGNHDITGNPTPENLVFYRDTYGPDRYSFDIAGWRFVVLNSHLMKFPEGAPKEASDQREWTIAALAEAHGMKGTIVFMHHPFYDRDIGEPDGYHSITKADRRMWLDLFADNNVKAVFSGHRHTTIPEHDWRGVRLVNTNAICNSFDGKPGLRIVKIGGEAFAQEFRSRDNIPEQVDLTV